ncbi:hypothetical protein GCM10007897_39280 [Sphingobium jiangsuense]|uniref:Uncharacterized protein n=1 Tax=Sphingobium jiangsuense TaxID=870476 RepID=A0A7W6BN82_9SPHN|nr:hypothetical protein [Sphingobium jiangsuense]MBB3926707.1 hypothetical protein [Sphingobium jiangsuense]GLT02515.1 hypothetical protein GCM10007897_39280 [Sphingobium jiangsuense]
MSATSDFYIARAAQSGREAQETDLVNVRERCLRAQAAWQILANRVLKSEADRRTQAAEKAARDASL